MQFMNDQREQTQHGLQLITVFIFDSVNKSIDVRDDPTANFLSLAMLWTHDHCLMLNVHFAHL